MDRTIVYIDMDNTLVDFQSGIDSLSPAEKSQYGPSEKHPAGNYDDVSGIFSKMKPLPGAIDAFHWMADHFDTYILSTAPWDNPSAWCDKLEWVKKHLGESAKKRLILSHHKNLLMGDYLIDDSAKNGAGEFKGQHLKFGTDYITKQPNEFPDWNSILRYFKKL